MLNIISFIIDLDVALFYMKIILQNSDENLFIRADVDFSQITIECLTYLHKFQISNRQFF